MKNMVLFWGGAKGCIYLPLIFYYQEEHHNAELAFDKVDRGNTGFISRTDLKNVLAEVRLRLTEEESLNAEGLLLKAGRISREAFLDWYISFLFSEDASEKEGESGQEEEEEEYEDYEDDYHDDDVEEEVEQEQTANPDRRLVQGSTSLDKDQSHSPPQRTQASGRGGGAHDLELADIDDDF
jgi:hypothetical protein